MLTLKGIAKKFFFRRRTHDSMNVFGLKFCCGCTTTLVTIDICLMENTEHAMKRRKKPKQMTPNQTYTNKEICVSIVGMPIQQASTASRNTQAIVAYGPLRNTHSQTHCDKSTHIYVSSTMSIQSQPQHAYHAKRYDARLKTLQNIR